jgi:hypothetical protein
MENKTLNGTWEVIVTYGKGYGDYNAQKLICRAELTQTKLRINGIIIDVGGVGMSPDKAIITGTYKKGLLKFIKQYDSLHTLVSDNNLEIDRSQKGKKIYYEARYDEKKDEFFGTWSYKVKIFGLITIGSYGQGTWSMKRG